MKQNLHLISCLFLFSAVIVPAVSPAMPTRAELNAAQSIVGELMAEDVAALRAGKADAKTVAEKAVGYAQDATTDAAKYLLLQGAFYNYTNAKAYDQAAETVERLRAAIPDIDPETLSKMISKALRKGRAGGRLSEMLEGLDREVRYARMMADVDAALKDNPKDKKLLRTSAEYHALTGDWKDALAKFEQLGGKFDDVVAFEKGKNSKLAAVGVGDFWWNYPVAGESEDTINGFKRHAVRFYLKALKDAEFKGLKRTIVEKRLAAVGSSALAEEQAALMLPVGEDGVRPPNQTFKLDEKTELKMVGCPAGTVLKTERQPNLGYWMPPFTISRPFWCAVYPTTYGQWKAFAPQATINPVAMKVGGLESQFAVHVDDAHAYCKWLTEKFKSQIPKGYVFRFPTFAEWQYINLAGTSEYNFGSWSWMSKKRTSSEQVNKLRRLLPEKDRNLPEADFVALLEDLAWPVGRTGLNAWGVWDVAGRMFVLDVYVDGVTGQEDGKPVFPAVAPTDPFLYPAGLQDGGKLENFAKHPFFTMNKMRQLKIKYPFRIILGPDLVKERSLAK